MKKLFYILNEKGNALAQDSGCFFMVVLFFLIIVCGGLGLAK